MFRSVIISPDLETSGSLLSALAATGHVALARKFDTYPPAADLARTLRARETHILFLSFESAGKALDIIQALDDAASQVQIVAFRRAVDPQTLRDSMRAGVREFLTSPFERAAVMDTLAHVKALLERRPAVYPVTNQVFSFLPSKAGVGASTIALNVSAAMARNPDTRVLLADFDLSSGMLRFMLKLKNEFSVTDAIEHAADMDENLWPPLVTAIGELDVLHAGRINPSLRIEPEQIHNLAAFMRRNYQALCFDLSGNLEKYSLELMQESKQILLVCTPEIPSLHLAREKMAFLEQMNLQQRVSVLLTRVQKRPGLTGAQVEDLLGVPVTRAFPNDYQAIQNSVSSGEPVPKGSELGKSFAEFAATLMNQKPVLHRPSTSRKFLEFVSAAVSFPAPGRD